MREHGLPPFHHPVPGVMGHESGHYDGADPLGDNEAEQQEQGGDDDQESQDLSDLHTHVERHQRRHERRDDLLKAGGIRC